MLNRMVDYYTPERNEAFRKDVQRRKKEAAAAKTQAAKETAELIRRGSMEELKFQDESKTNADFREALTERSNALRAGVVDKEGKVIRQPLKQKAAWNQAVSEMSRLPGFDRFMTGGQPVSPSEQRIEKGADGVYRSVTVPGRGVTPQPTKQEPAMSTSIPYSPEAEAFNVAQESMNRMSPSFFPVLDRVGDVAEPNIPEKEIFFTGEETGRSQIRRGIAEDVEKIKKRRSLWGQPGRVSLRDRMVRKFKNPIPAPGSFMDRFHGNISRGYSKWDGPTSTIDAGVNRARGYTQPARPVSWTKPKKKQPATSVLAVRG